MLNGSLLSTLSCPKGQPQPNSAIQENAKIFAAAAGNYNPGMAQDLQKIATLMSHTLQQALTVSRVILQQKLVEISLFEEKNQQKPVKGEAHASQQQHASAKTNLAANVAAIPAQNELRAQEDTQYKESQRIYVAEHITHNETLDDTLRYQDDAQCTLASNKNGAQDSADQHRRSKTYLTEGELDKIMNGEDSASASFGLMNYSVTSYSLDEAADQKTTFSTTGFGLELNDRTRYRLDSSNDQFSVGKRAPYSSLYDANPLDTSFSPKNTMGWLMHVFQEITDTALEVLQLLGRKAERSTANVRLVTKASKDIKSALEKIGESGTWKWGDQKYENGKPVFDQDGNPVFVPKKEYEQIFQTMREQGITIDGMDVLEWLQKRSKKSTATNEQSSLLPEMSNQSWQETLWGIGKAVLNPFTGISDLTKGDMNKLESLKPSKDNPKLAEIVEGEISKGDLLRLSSILDDAVVERNDANSKLQGQLTAQTQLYQSFQNAVINIGFVIAELMKTAFVKIPI